MNSSAQKLLLEDPGVSADGRTLAEIAPQIAQLVASGESSGIVQYARQGELLTLAVKATPIAMAT
jgi:two-component system nitrogen regulation sensor histidine kinase NtrY